MRPELDISESELVVDELCVAADVESLRSEWAALWSRCSPTTPFQSPEWILAWMRHVSFGAPWVLTVRSRGRLVGIAPFCIQTVDPADLQRIYLMGTGISDYLDVLCEPGCESTMAAIVFNHLNHRGGHWHESDFQQLRPESPLLTRDFGPTCEDEITIQEQCPILRAEGGRFPIPSSFLDKLAYEERRLNREGRIIIVRATEQTFDHDFDALLRLHGARWSRRGEGGVLSDAAIQRFHTDAAQALLTRGVLRLYSLSLDARPIACYYGFLHQRRAYYYLGGFDPAFERLSVGNQVVWHALREAEQENALTFDFLRGQEPYKYRWGAQDRPNYQRQLRCRNEQ